MGMKGFIFTVDALFALIIAAIAISVLLYVNLGSGSNVQTASSEAYSLEQNLLQTTVGQAAPNINYAAYAADSGSSSQYTWSEFGYNQTLSSSTQGFGPQKPNLLFQFNAHGMIAPDPAVADGMVVFTTILSNSLLFALNASTGKPLFVSDTGAPFSGAPIIYNHMIIAANTLGYINAISENGNNILWSANIGSGFSAPISVLDGYIEANMTLIDPANGTIVLDGGTNQQGAYDQGAFYAVDHSAGSYLLNAYSLYAGALTTIWSVGAAPHFPTPPTIAGNNIYMGVDKFMAIFPRGSGKSVFLLGAHTNVMGGVSALGNYEYLTTVQSLYKLDSSGTIIFRAPDKTNTVNSLVSVTPSIIYALPVDAFAASPSESIESYSQTGTQLWNLSIPTVDSLPVSYMWDIPIAYGNAYVTDGNSIYAFGTCSATPSESMLGAIASFYLSKEGGCATVLFSSSTGISKAGMFINGTYAPSLYTADFNPASHSHITNPTPSLPQGSRITMVAWINPTPNQGTPIYNGVFSYGARVCSGTSAQIGIQASGLPEVATWCNDFVPASGPKVNFGKWNFLAATINGQSVTIYLNNGIDTGTLPSLPNFVSTTMSIGSTDGDGSRGFNGLITDVQVYNSVLTQNQIDQIYNNGESASPVANASLVGWWPLQGDANDYSNSSNTGFPDNVSYVRGNFTPSSLSSAFQISSASVPLSIGVNGTYRIYNVSVAVWH